MISYVADLLDRAGAAGLRAANASTRSTVGCLWLARPRADAHVLLAAAGISAALGHRETVDTWASRRPIPCANGSAWAW
jgi:hypothetical protein